MTFIMYISKRPASLVVKFLMLQKFKYKGRPGIFYTDLASKSISRHCITIVSNAVVDGFDRCLFLVRHHFYISIT